MLSNSWCLLILGHASEHDEERATHIFSDTPLTLNGHKYCVEHVSRNKEHQLLLHIAKVKEDTLKDFEVSAEQEELLTVAEVARILRVDETTVRRWIKDNVLAVVTLPTRGARRVYRVRKSTLDALLSGKAVARG